MADTDRPPTQRQREASADFDAEHPNGGDPEAAGGSTIDEMAEGGEAADGEEDDGQLFVMEQGQRVTLSSLYKRGTKVLYEFKLNGKAVKGGAGMGLIAFTNPEKTLIVPIRAGAVKIDPTYEPDGSVKHVTVRQEAKPQFLYDSATEAGQVALRGE